MNSSDFLYSLKGITPEEFAYVQKLMDGMNDEQMRQFIAFYGSKRHSPTDILLFTLLGFVIVAGVQRFMIGQIGMGILYVFTFGLCFVGTIVDAINHKSLAFEFNQKVAAECAQMIRFNK